ncbi:hypothetical protein ABZX30_23985 [Streptomyces sp. NPDC004542]|uniref:hypothetical protein n=1 Tax=Streptomyces sp. NPDC004542 TaxID=3154281 RepID=UPI0033BB07F8
MDAEAVESFREFVANRLIAWERASGLDEPYRARLVLVTIGSDEVVPLSGVQKERSDEPKAWRPVFARR